MPLPNIALGRTRRCKAKCKKRGARCFNPAAFSMAVCRFHGGRKLETIRAGEAHPQFKHGRETREAKAERSKILAELRNLEQISFAIGFATGQRWLGRKPRIR